MSKLIVLGCDPSLANTAFAKMRLDLETLDLELLDLSIVQTDNHDKKTKAVRASSSDFRRAKEIQAGLIRAAAGCYLCFCEIPHGSQSAISARGLGIAVGVLASCPIPIVQVNHLEVKMASVGKKNATKREMIDWAVALHPAANWLRANGKKDGKIINDNEHMADAVAAVYAGVRTSEFESVREIVRSSRSA